MKILTTFFSFLIILCLIPFFAFSQNNYALFGWGANNYGQLGDGTTDVKYSPTQIGAATNWIKSSCGEEFTIAIKSDGSLWAWGINDYGQLGDGSTTNKISPVQIGSGTNWLSISCGSAHTHAIKNDGTLWAWGLNIDGQLGDGTTTTKTNPVQIGSSTDWVKVSCGGDHSLAIKSNGSLWAWGLNSFGQLGDGTTIDINYPVQIEADTNWVSVSGGLDFSLGVKNDGTLWAWGSNGSGQLGDGTTIQKNSPIQIGSDTNWVLVSCGSYHSIAKKSDGSIWSWGLNNNGQLGDGTITEKHSPFQIGSSTNWANVSCGFNSTFSIKNDGTLWAFGWNNIGQLGDGTTTSKSSPVRIGNSSKWSEIKSGGNHTIGLMDVSSINIGNLSGSSFCSGDYLVIPFTITGTYNSSNTFTVQLSNSSGSFGSPVMIGSVVGTSSGTISVAIPTNTPIGSGYRIRVVSSSPIVTGSDNGSNITILSKPSPSINGQTSVCETNPYIYSCSTPVDVLNQWYVSSGTITGSTSSNFINVTWGSSPSGTITLTQTNIYNNCRDSIKTAIIINPLPKPNITGSTSVCTGNISLYSATSSVGVSCLWSVIQGTIQGSASSTFVNILWNNARSGTIYLIQSNNLTGCRDSTSKQITISPLPVPVITGLTKVCANSISSFTSNTITTVTSCTWNVIGGTIQGSTSGTFVNILWSSASSGTVILIQKSNEGCKDSTNFEVMINPLPVPKITGDTSLCAKSVAQYKTDTQAGTVNRWRVTNGAILGSSTINSVVIKWGNAGIGNVKLIQTISSTGCADSIEIPVTVNQLPTPTITGEFTILPNSTKTYETLNNISISNNWSVVGGIINGSTTNSSITVTWGSVGVGTINLLQIVTATGCVDSAFQHVTITNSLKPTILGKSPACEYDIENYKTTKKSGAVNVWTVTGGSISGSNTKDSIIVNWGLAGTGSIKVVQTILQSGFKDSTSQSIIINKLPEKPIITRGGTDLASNYSTGNQWYYKDSLITYAVYQYYTSEKTGFYKVKYTDLNGCSVFSDPYYFTTDVVETQITANKLKIYPIPTGNVLNIEYNTINPSKMKLKLMTLLGESIYEENINLTEDTYRKQIDLSKITNGIYLIMLQNESEMIIRKFVVNK
ncbi:MAG: C-terminal target protein [Ignavibacteria bacterium]|nr:C-terminal target protein [Ignavibacteria bacterium]